MRKPKLKDALLKSLLVADTGLALFEELYSNPRNFAKNGPSFEVSRSAMYSIVSRLSKQGLVEKKFDENKLLLGLTSAGRDWLLKFGEVEVGQWDGIWRIVIFDIPETHRKVRSVLRDRLKSWGFVSWQKSVWASKKPLTGEIRKLVGDLGVSEWVLVIESANTGK